jgi:hypothetical protein
VLHEFFDSSQHSGLRGSSDEPTGRWRGVKGKLAQLLVEADELDWCARLPTVVPTVDALTL